MFRVPSIPRFLSISVISATGVFLTVVNFRHLLAQEQVYSLVFGGLVPVLISLGITGVSLYLWREGWEESSLQVLTGWFLAGVVLTTVFGGIIIGEILREGGTLAQTGGTIFLFPTYGSIPVLFTGLYDVQRRLRERAIRRNRDFMERIEELAEIGGWEFDPSTGYIEYTEGGSHLRELTESPTTLDSIVETYHEEDRERIQRALDHCRQRGVPFDIEGRITTAEQHQRWVRVRGERVEDGGEMKLRGAIQDITLTKQREQRIMVLNRVLRHNIRNELNVISGNAELLGEKLSEIQLDIDRTEFDPVLEAAITEVSTVSADLSRDIHRLRELVRQLDDVDIDTLQTNAECIQKTSDRMLTLAEKARRFEEAIGADMAASLVDIQPIVTDVVDTYRTRYPHTTFDLSLRDATTIGTPEAVNIIVDELVENAIVHNPDDTPGVSVTVSTDVESEVRICVADTGPGIPEIERQVLAKGEETSLVHSNGVGLWTVNWLITRLDGTTTIEDTSEGTTIEVTLPTADEKRAHEESESEMPEHSPTRR